jgi:hypothetical protein
MVWGFIFAEDARSAFAHPLRAGRGPHRFFPDAEVVAKSEAIEVRGPPPIPKTVRRRRGLLERPVRVIVF